MKIFLVRHGAHSELGKVLSGRSQISLDAEGERQISRLAEQLADKGIARIETSPRPRTRRTPDIIARRRAGAVEVADALAERSVARRVGKECVWTCRARYNTNHSRKEVSY